VSWLHPFKEQKLVVVGDRKMAVFDDTQPWEDKLLLYSHRIDWHNSMPLPVKAEAERLAIRRAEPLRCECEHFLNCMSNGCKPLTNGREGLRVLKILNAAQLSMDNHNSRVELSQGDGKCKNSSQMSSVEKEKIFIHASAVIDPDCKVENGTKIWHFSHILSGSRIGKNCNIGQNVVVGPDVTIGRNCKIQNNVSVYKGVTLEDGVFCGPSMVFTNIYNPRADIPKMDQVRPTLVKKGATIGANATILCGTTLGNFAFVGAGAVVTQDISDHALVVGNPAKQIGWVCRCGEKLMDDLHCRACGNTYSEVNEGLKLVSASTTRIAKRKIR
jgi:UDP-2-acetamido-3-amino-2,3-dideoxy-glucuronate N-acetyltransferase